MKLRITLKATVVAVMAFAFLFSACDDRVLYPVVDLALLSVRAGDMDVPSIPGPIEAEDWNDEEYEPGNSEGGVIVVKDWSKEAVYFTAKANKPGSIITWGRSKGSARPERFFDLRQPTAIEDNDDFFFRVENLETREVKYYRFKPGNARNVRILANLTAAGREANKVPKEVNDDIFVPVFGQPTVNQLEGKVGMERLAALIMNDDYRGQVDITDKETIKALVAATPQDAAARIRYAIAPSIGQAAAGNFGPFVDPAVEEDGPVEDPESKPRVVVVQDEQGKNITQTHQAIDFQDGNILAVEVTAQNDEVNYYGFVVYSGRLATIAKMTIGGRTVTGMGSQHFDWEKVVPGSFASADQPTAGFKINIQLEDPDGSYEWVRRTALQAEPNPTALSSDINPTVKFAHEEVLVIKVHSARYNNNDNRYYRIQVNLLAANFKKHPKSAAYTITEHDYPTTPVTFEAEPNVFETQNRILTTAQGTRKLSPATITPLSVTLDRGGTFTYQWYTANSWYGGYGFDQDNNIAHDPAVKQKGPGTPPAYNPVTNDYLDVDYFPNPFEPDEKGNISLHNGGNQYYRLPYNGMPISGATQSTYTPTIDARNRPFITGFSNQTQYYWVVVTDAQGLKAVSDRAAIVAEWGEEFNMGVPTGNKVTKKHHIVDMHAYSEGGTGLKSNPRNPTAFKAGNHGDEYHIPITFPSGFKVTDYSVITCQALFYLSDGRPWIQNWTQGDFGFSNANKEKLVIWYNLTNDNATRGLASSGNEPSGGGLNELPAHLVVQPAGTKPMKDLPPFEGTDRDNRDKPRPNNDAQGWFTPYIEIVELRFEGPAR